MTLSPPVKVSVAPPKVSAPVPILVKAAVPAMTELMVAALPLASGMTEIEGVVPANVKIFPGVPLLSKNQPAPEFKLMSPKIRLPIVLAESKWITVGSVVKSTWLKFAVLPLPLATVPFNQFAPLLHSPPVTTLVHTLLCAFKVSALTTSRRATVA